MSEQPDRDEKHEPKSRLWVFALVFIACAGFVVFVLLKVPYAIEHWVGIEDKATGVGEYGDQYGMANALFAGLAFAGVIVAMLMQSKELQYQREELIRTKKVLDGQRVQLEEQAASMKQQTFENTFFKLLSLAVETIEAHTYGSSGQTQDTGREAIFSRMEAYKNNMKSSFVKAKNAQKQSGSGSGPLKPHDVIRAYQVVSEDMSSQHGHLFRQIGSTLNFVHRSDMADKQFYMDILNAQLSQSELRVFFYMSLLLDECRDTTELFNLYGFFRLLDVNQLVSPDDPKLLDLVHQEHEQHSSKI